MLQCSGVGGGGEVHGGSCPSRMPEHSGLIFLSTYKFSIYMSCSFCDLLLKYNLKVVLCVQTYDVYIKKLQAYQMGKLHFIKIRSLPRLICEFNDILTEISPGILRTQQKLL